MSLTLLKRHGRYGILGNENGATFLADADDEAFWGYFERPVVRPYRTIRRLTALLGQHGDYGGDIVATWHSFEMPVVTHGSLSIACYHDAGRDSYTPGKWIVCEAAP